MLGCFGKGWNWCMQMVAALLADSEEKLCRLVSDFGRVCKRRKLRVNMGEKKFDVLENREVYDLYVNVCQMHETKWLTIR